MNSSKAFCISAFATFSEYPYFKESRSTILVNDTSLTDITSSMSNDNFSMSALRSALPTCDISFGTLVYTVALGGVDYRTDITELVIENTEMSSVYGLEKFDCLETVRLGRKRIENISAFQNTHSRATIRSVDLGFNLIQDVSPLSALTALESLDLRSNQISTVRVWRGSNS